MATILEHYLKGEVTVRSISDFSRAVCQALDIEVDPCDDVSTAAFFEAYDTCKITEQEYDNLMRTVSISRNKPTDDPLESFRPDGKLVSNNKNAEQS